MAMRVKCYKGSVYKALSLFQKLFNLLINFVWKISKIYLDTAKKSENLLNLFFYLLHALEKIKSDPEFAVLGCHYEIAREDHHQAVL